MRTICVFFVVITGLLTSFALNLEATLQTDLEQLRLYLVQLDDVLAQKSAGMPAAGGMVPPPPGAPLPPPAPTPGAPIPPTPPQLMQPGEHKLPIRVQKREKGQNSRQDRAFLQELQEFGQMAVPPDISEYIGKFKQAIRNDAVAEKIQNFIMPLLGKDLVTIFNGMQSGMLQNEFFALLQPLFFDSNSIRAETIGILNNFIINIVAANRQKTEIEDFGEQEISDNLFLSCIDRNSSSEVVECLNVLRIHPQFFRFYALQEEIPSVGRTQKQQAQEVGMQALMAELVGRTKPGMPRRGVAVGILQQLKNPQRGKEPDMSKYLFHPGRFTAHYGDKLSQMLLPTKTPVIQPRQRNEISFEKYVAEIIRKASQLEEVVDALDNLNRATKFVTEEQGRSKTYWVSASDENIADAEEVAKTTLNFEKNFLNKFGGLFDEESKQKLHELSEQNETTRIVEYAIINSIQETKKAADQAKQAGKSIKSGLLLYEEIYRLTGISKEDANRLKIPLLQLLRSLNRVPLAIDVFLKNSIKNITVLQKIKDEKVTDDINAIIEPYGSITIILDILINNSRQYAQDIIPVVQKILALLNKTSDVIEYKQGLEEIKRAIPSELRLAGVETLGPIAHENYVEKLTRLIQAFESGKLSDILAELEKIYQVNFPLTWEAYQAKIKELIIALTQSALLIALQQLQNINSGKYDKFTFPGLDVDFGRDIREANRNAVLYSLLKGKFDNSLKIIRQLVDNASPITAENMRTIERTFNNDLANLSHAMQIDKTLGSRLITGDNNREIESMKEIISEFLKNILSDLDNVRIG